MRIQHNIMAMNAYRNYNNNVSAMRKNLEKLSSGYKINRAGDDAAGLAISEKMRAQITGLETAQKNAKDGISLVQTAEGALTEVHDMLNRMVTLATQSANGTYDNDVDRQQLQKELDQLRDEIDRIADSSNFNGIKLLDGTQTAQSANPLGDKAELLEALDGMKATPGGKATISFKTTAAGGTPAAEAAAVDSVTDGQPMAQAGTPAKFTINVGGLKADATGFDISGKIGGTDINSGSSTKNLSTISNISTSWTTNDTITITDADGTGHTYDQATYNTWADVKNAAKADGITLDEGQAVSAVAITSKLGGLVDNSGTGANIVAGTTTVGTLKGLSLTSGGPTLGSMYDITLKDADGNAVGSVTDATVIENGYSIELTAKYGGEMSSADQTAVGALAQDASTGITNTDVAGGATIADAGLNEGNGAASPSTPVYSLKFDFSKLAVGQSFSIGDKRFCFSNNGTTLADGSPKGANDVIIDLSSITDDTSAADNVADIYDDIAKAINAALTDSTNGAYNDRFSGKVVNNADSSGKIYTIELSAKDDTITSAQTNLGAVRLSANTAHADLIDPDYNPKTDTSGATVSNSADEFATVTYKGVDLTKLKAGSSIEIAGKKVEVVGSDYDGTTGFIAGSGTNPDSYVLKLTSATATASAAELTNAFEQLGFASGQVTFDTTANKVTIKGTTVGETGSDLQDTIDGAGGVSITPPAAAATTINIGGTTIEVGSTNLKDLLTKEITYGTGANQKKFKLGDVFDIKVGSTTVTSTTSGTVGGNQEITLTAKNVGQLSDDVLAALKPTDASNNAMEVTQVNGYDEGSNPAGMKTEYGLTINLSKAAGGNSFTFGNVNGAGKSITFELSYDNLGTLNGTVDNNNHVDVAENGDKRVQINLFGLSNADATKAIEKAVKDTIGGDFDVKASLSGSNVVLSAIGKNDWNADTNDTNWGEVRFSNSNDANGVFTNNIYNPAGGVASSQIGTYAQLSYSFDPGKIKAGDELTIGGTTIYFGDTDKIETVTDDSGNNVTKVTVKAEELGKNPNKIVSAFERAGFTAGQLKFADGKVTITDANKTGNTAKDFEATLKGSADSVISLKRELDKGADGMQGGLVLQIGDTAEAFNQLRVSIQDMHTTSLGLADISIADQTSAAKAVDAIKAAINQVSDVRGTLGATQNRLDHTINNLSVMTENIQDAESTIRDTDVASEMMAYTKNNILIQSAQAMLAQANQVPQGVLQLLQ